MKKTSLENWLAQTPSPNSSLPQLVCVFTDEPLFSAQAGDFYRHTLRLSHACQRQVVDMDRSFDANHFVSLFSERSLFGDQTLIDLRLNQTKLSKEAAEALTQVSLWMGDGQTEHFLLVTGPRLNKTQEKSAGFQGLLNHGTEVICKMIGPDTMPAWVASTATRLGLQMERETIAWLVERTEGNLLSAHQTLEKIAIEHQGLVPLAFVQQVACDAARYNVFDLGPALLGADIRRILKMLEGLQAEGEAPTLVLWALQEEIRAIRDTRNAMQNGVSLAQACSQARIWGARQQLIAPALKRHTAQTLHQLTNWCYLAEKTIKGLSKGNPWTLFEIIGLGIGGIFTPAPLEQHA